MPCRFAAAALTLLIAAGCAARPGGSAAEVPKDLNNVETLADDAFDRALAGDREGARAAAARLAAIWPPLAEEVAEAGAVPADVAALDAAVAGLGRAAADGADGPALARAANAVSLRLEALYGLYRPAIPTAVLALDALGRELLLDAMAGDYPRATGHADDLMATWKRLREQVVGAGGAKTADLLDGTLAQLRGAVDRRDGDAAGRLAAQVIDDVDVLEAVF